jgi:hypothetical protein
MIGWLLTWFGLITLFIGLLKLVTTTDYALPLIHTLYKSLQHALNFLILLCLHRFSPGNGSKYRRFFSFSVLRLRSSLAGDCLHRSVGRSDGRLNCCQSSAAQSFLASGLVEPFDQDLFSLLDMYVFGKWGLLFDEERGRSFCVGATVVAP